MYGENRVHIRDLIDGIGSDTINRDGVYFFIADEISDTGFIMKTVLNLMNKGSNVFCFFGKYKDIWYQTVKDILKQSDADCKNLRKCDNIDDAAEEAAAFLNNGRDVYLLSDSQGLCSIAADKIREHGMYC